MTIESILERIRESPQGADVWLTIEERLVLDPLYASGWPEIGYYGGHKVFVMSPFAWRVGERNPLNVYEGDRSVCQCHNTQDAARIVKAANFARAEGKL